MSSQSLEKEGKARKQDEMQEKFQLHAIFCGQHATWQINNKKNKSKWNKMEKKNLKQHKLKGKQTRLWKEMKLDGNIKKWNDIGERKGKRWTKMKGTKMRWNQVVGGQDRKQTKNRRAN